MQGSGRHRFHDSNIDAEMNGGRNNDNDDPGVHAHGIADQKRR